MNFVLNLWLVEVPEGALEFCRLMLLMICVCVTDGGIGHVVNASGKVSKFKTTFSIITLSCIPIGFVIFKYGFPPYSLLVVFIVADSVWRIIQLWMASRILKFPVIEYSKKVYLPIALVSFLMVIAVILTSLIRQDTILWHLCRFMIIFVITSLAACYVGLNRTERAAVFSYVRNAVNKIRN